MLSRIAHRMARQFRRCPSTESGGYCAASRSASVRASSSTSNRVGCPSRCGIWTLLNRDWGRGEVLTVRLGCKGRETGITLARREVGPHAASRIGAAASSRRSSCACHSYSALSAALAALLAALSALLAALPALLAALLALLAALAAALSALLSALLAALSALHAALLALHAALAALLAALSALLAALLALHAALSALLAALSAALASGWPVCAHARNTAITCCIASPPSARTFLSSAVYRRSCIASKNRGSTPERSAPTGITDRKRPGHVDALPFAMPSKMRSSSWASACGIPSSVS